MPKFYYINGVSIFQAKKFIKFIFPNVVKVVKNDEEMSYDTYLKEPNDEILKNELESLIKDFQKEFSKQYRFFYF